MCDVFVLCVVSSGDSTVRLWDVSTELPRATLKGHKNWVLCVAWAPNGLLLASGGMDCDVRLWDAATGKPKGKPLKGHTKWITSLAWEPMHRSVWPSALGLCCLCDVAACFVLS
jgi:ribosome assembly protein 4